MRRAERGLVDRLATFLVAYTTSQAYLPPRFSPSLLRSFSAASETPTSETSTSQSARTEPASQLKAPTQELERSVAVVGGGLAGLAVAATLRALSLPVHVLEATE